MGTQSRLRTVRAAPAAAAGLFVGRLLAARRRRATQPVERLTSATGGRVIITRDARGVPHIQAESRNDALFGFGYALACDRLFQLELIRRAATGRLAELAGPDSLPSDRLMRLLGLGRLAQRLAAELEPDERAAYLALANGINLRLATRQLPVEFRATRLKPEPWTPADSIAGYRLMAWSLGSFYESDLVAERVRAAIGDQWTRVIFDHASPTDPLIVRELQPLTAEARVASAGVVPSSGGSNAWAVAGARSSTGAPMLANDPHLELLNPSVWYEAVLDAPGFTVRGVSMPGFPGIGIGRTRDVAWGLTSAMLSQTFVYRETLDGAGAHYRNGASWRALEVRDELINVRGQPPEVMRVRSTSRGPLISDVRPDLCDGPVSLHWTGFESGVEAATLLRAGAARDFTDLDVIRRVHTVPSFGMVAADQAGNIGVFTIGKTPARPPRCGLLDPQLDFPPRYISADELPYEVNPARGWVLAANNRIVDERYPYELHGLWAMEYRARRIADVLTSNARCTLGDMHALQHDVYSIEASELVPVLLELLGEVAPDWAWDVLYRWDFRVTADSRAAALWETFLVEWTHSALAHRLPTQLAEQLVATAGLLAVPNRFVNRLLRGELPEWLSADTRAELVRSAFERALAWLASRLGPDRANWTWGALHTLTFAHPLGTLPGPQQRRFNVGPFPAPGDRDTVNPGHWTAGQPFAVIGGASMRYLADLSRPEHADITNTLGQHGSPLSRHYRDQTASYLDGAIGALRRDV
jgi:penicillin amidase